MSRIGRLVIKLPAAVAAEYKDSAVTVKGPLGTLKQKIENPAISVEIKDKELHVKRSNDEAATRAAHGLYRALIKNMVSGVEKHYEKGLVINGVGYKVQKQGKKIVLNIGYSHPVEVTEPAGITIEVVPAVNPPELKIKGIDKVAVGQCAAAMRDLRRPEPYHGYGIRYKDERIVLKEGKTAGKK